MYEFHMVNYKKSDSLKRLSLNGLWVCNYNYVLIYT